MNYDHTEQQSFEEWINDPIAQAEYKRWKLVTELQRAGLPDPHSPTFADAVREFLKESQ